MRIALGLAGVVVALGIAPVAAAQIVFGQPVESIPDIIHGYRGAYADLDGDGFVDVAFARLVDHQAKLFFGDGRGHFGPATPTTPAIDATAIGFGDLDGDGHAELMTAPYTPGHLEFQVWKGLGGSQFSGPVSYAVAGAFPSPASTFIITARDADGDADVDVTVVVAQLSLAGATAVNLLLNDGAGNLTPQVVATGPSPPTGLFGILRADVADLNADGLADAVYTGVTQSGIGLADATTHLVVGQPGGTFVESQAWDDTFQLGLVDVDHDGLLDLVTIDDYVQSSPEQLVTYLGLGGAQFAAQPPTVLPIGAQAEALADFDGDAVPDLLFLHSAFVIFPTWAVAPGDGRGGFDVSKVAYTHPGGDEPRFFQFAVDTTGDGGLDLVDEGDPRDAIQSIRVSTSPNWTYPAGAPQLDLGHPQFGGDGWPGTRVNGSFEPDEPVTVELWEAGESLPTFLVAGFTESFAPFKGGVMVPEPDVLFGPISTGGGPMFELEGRWPGGLPAGESITLQWWIADPIAPQGLSASTAVRITQP